MRSKYYPPVYEGTKFHCILCNVYASQSWSPLVINTQAKYLTTSFTGSYCHHCGDWTFWHEYNMVVPSDSPVEPPHADMPPDCVLDYKEARDVFSKSPRAAAALLRLCIQKLMLYLGQKGKNINDDIASLVSNGLPVLVQRALDYCRVVGNNAVHPGEINLTDTPEIAQKLFQMINFVIEDRISRPKQIEELYRQLPEGDRDAIEKRDAKE